VNVHIGVLLLDAAKKPINVDGSLKTGGGYSFIQKLNSDTPPTGTTDPTGVTDRWGQCVAGNAALAFVEEYPKRPSPDPMVTDFTRYGDGAAYNRHITPGAVNTIGLRLPVTFQNGGNTGGVQGYLWHGGHNVPASAVTGVVAFSQQFTVSTCGVEGLAASAAVLGTATGPDRTYYKVDYLSAGQCAAPSQLYSLQLTCHIVCGATDRRVAVLVGVRRGLWPRVDITF
jgi:hypothetical protein